VFVFFQEPSAMEAGRENLWQSFCGWRFTVFVFEAQYCPAVIQVKTIDGENRPLVHLGQLTKALCRPAQTNREPSRLAARPNVRGI